MVNSKTATWIARLLIGLPVLLLTLIVGSGYLLDHSGLLPYAGLHLAAGKTPRYQEGSVYQNEHSYRYTIYNGIDGTFPELTIFDADGKELATVGGNADSVIAMCDLNNDGRTDIYTYEGAHWPYHRSRVLYYVEGEYRYLWAPQGGFDLTLLHFAAIQNLNILYWFIPAMLLAACGVALTVKRKHWTAWEIAPLAILVVLEALPLCKDFTPLPPPAPAELGAMVGNGLEKIAYVGTKLAAAEALEPAPRDFFRYQRELAPLLIEKIGDDTPRETPLSFQDADSRRTGDAAHLALAALCRIDDPEWFLTEEERQIFDANPAMPFFDRFRAYLARPGNLEKLQRQWHNHFTRF